MADAKHPNSTSQSSSTVGSVSQTVQSLQDGVVNRTERQEGKKEEDTHSLHKNFHAKDAVAAEVDRAAWKTPLPRSPSKSIPFVAPLKSDPRITAASDSFFLKKQPRIYPKAESSVCVSNSAENSAIIKPNSPKFITPPAEKPAELQVHAGTEKCLALEVPVSADKPSITPIPNMSRPLSAPLVPGPRPAVSVVSMVQAAPILTRSVSATGRLGPEPTASATQSNVPQSYRNAIIGVPVGGNSCAYSQNHSAISMLNASTHSQAPALVSAPLFSPHSSDRMDPNPIKPNASLGLANHHDMLENGALWNEHPQRDSRLNLRVDCGPLINEVQSFDMYNPMQSRSRDHLPSEFPACTSGRQGHVLPDEFPHLDIINELLDDEHGLGMVTGANSGHQNFGNGPHYLNRHYSFPGDPAMPSGPLGSSGRFDRTRSYHDDFLQYGHGAYGRTYDALGEDMIPQLSPQPYVNGQIDGYALNQWHMRGSDIPSLGVRHMDDNRYPCYLPEYQNLNSGINGYTVFRPSNGL